VTIKVNQMKEVHRLLVTLWMRNQGTFQSRQLLEEYNHLISEFSYMESVRNHLQSFLDLQ
jgi:hypothetical protein